MLTVVSSYDGIARRQGPFAVDYFFDNELAMLDSAAAEAGEGTIRVVAQD